MKKFVVILIALFMVLSLSACGKPVEESPSDLPDDSQNEIISPSSEPAEEDPAPAATPNISKDDTTAETGRINHSGIYEHSGDLWDFVFEADGSFYELPCDLQIFLSDGWTVSDSPMEQNVPAGENMLVQLSKDGRQLVLAVRNFDAEVKDYRDCTAVIAKLTVEEAFHEISFLGRKVSELTLENMESILGKNYYVRTNEEEGLTNCVYLEEGSSENGYHFFFDSEKGTFIEGMIVNIVSDYEEELAPTFANMNDDLFDGMVQLDGDIFMMPISMQNFTDNGWMVINGDTVVQPGEMAERALHMTKDRYVVAFDVKNLTDAPLPAAECSVVCVYDSEIFGDTMPELTLAGNIRIGMAQADLEAALPAFEKEVKGNFTQYKVSDPELQIFLMLSVDHATGLVDDINFRVLKPLF